MLEDHVSPQQLIETNIAPEISVPVKEDSDTQNIISSKGSKNQNFVRRRENNFDPNLITLIQNK